MSSTEKFCLRWNDFESNISAAFCELREDKDFFDVTLACDDDQMQAHKVILSACSPFFRSILRRNKHEHPLLYLKGVKYTDLVSVLTFMYQGEVNVAQEELNSFLAVAEDLKVKGLTQNNSNPREPNAKSSGLTQPRVRQIPEKKDPLPQPKRHRPEPPPAPVMRDPPTLGKYQHEDDIQEIVPIKSEPINNYPLDTQTHQITPRNNIEQAYPATEMNHMVVSGVVADPTMEYEQEEYGDYEEYGPADGSYDTTGMTLSQDGNKELDDLILTNMAKSKNALGKTEWICNLCGKKGHHKRSIMVHVETHLDLAEQHCQYCDKKAKTREALRVHIKDYHKKKGELYYNQ